MTTEGAKLLASALGEVFSGDSVVGRDLVQGANLVDVLHQAAEALDRIADAGFDIARAIEQARDRPT